MRAPGRPKDSAQTKRRILDAAITEFSAHGLAGARVERITEAAMCNKAMLYRYFSSKEKLFDAVFDEIVVRTVDAVPMDVTDLPGYAARIFEQHLRTPNILRIATWDHLERGGAGMRLATVAEVNRAKVQKIEAAQAAGMVTSRYPAEVILHITLALSRPLVGTDVTIPAATPSHHIADAVRAALTE
ncbi:MULTISPECIES: TetR family transcriptional regulator [Streptomyces]|uniref:HTH tetR-type domain-containing protein n=2 Tax=Streptomyces rhizosphaericus TaxID=114699 RepID=A0ABP4DBJ7_9ACTN|nr:MULTISPECIES: TetR family transcriptional regulator [Streptomyces violaceusniger group]